MPQRLPRPLLVHCRERQGVHLSVSSPKSLPAQSELSQSCLSSLPRPQLSCGAVGSSFHGGSGQRFFLMPSWRILPNFQENYRLRCLSIPLTFPKQDPSHALSPVDKISPKRHPQCSPPGLAWPQAGCAQDCSTQAPSLLLVTTCIKYLQFSSPDPTQNHHRIPE